MTTQLTAETTAGPTSSTVDTARNRSSAAGETRTVNVLTRDGEALARTIDLPGEVFDVAVNVPLIHQVVVAQLAAARQGTHKTKTRGEVRGGGKKPYRQKGTGRARQGSTRAPQFTGGGVVHGPVPRDYSQRTPKKMKSAALRGALSDRARGDRVHVMESLVAGESPSTKDAVTALATVSERRHVLVVAERSDTVTWKSLRNATSVHLLDPGQLNTYDVLVSDDVVFIESALAVFLTAAARGRSARLRGETVQPAGAATPARTPETAPDVEPHLIPEAVPSQAPPTATPEEAIAVTDSPSSEPATSAGRTSSAGGGVSDEQMAREVADQTDPNLASEGVFEAESDGTATDTAVAKASADEIAREQGGSPS